MLNLAKPFNLGLAGALSAATPGPPPINPSDVFAISLWTGTAAAQDIVNGIDLATKGGLLITKSRNSADIWRMFDTKRGVNQYLPISTGSANSFPDSVKAYNANGFSLGAAAGVSTLNIPYVGWCFRKQPKFFDVVTYTGDGQPIHVIPHDLGCVPGLIILKRRDSAGSPPVSHIQANPGHQYNLLNDPSVPTVNDTTFAGVPADANSFYVGTNTIVNAAGGTFVAYLFAHDPTGIIACGSYVGNGNAAGPVVTIGWQPQFILVRRVTTGSGNWCICDTTRGMNNNALGDLVLNPNLAQAETAGDFYTLGSTGFQVTTTSISFNTLNDTYCYMAIKA